MDSYKIIWKNSAKKELKKLDKTIISRIIEKVEELAKNPYPSGCKKLVGTESNYRIRIGEYRVIYGVCSSYLMIEIIRVGHRQGIYRNL
jgi:mRNA interferase RelE/StbE